MVPMENALALAQLSEFGNVGSGQVAGVGTRGGDMKHSL